MPQRMAWSAELRRRAAAGGTESGQRPPFRGWRRGFMIVR